MHARLDNTKLYCCSTNDGCVNADNVIRQHCFSLIDELRFGVAQFIRDSITLRDSVDKYGFSLFCLGTKLVVL